MNSCHSKALVLHAIHCSARGHKPFLSPSPLVMTADSVTAAKSSLTKCAFAKMLSRISLFIVANALLASVDAAPPSFRVTDLGAGSAHGINDLGQVVGQSADGAPFLWSQKTGAVSLAKCIPGSILSCFDNIVAQAINNKGQIVGYVPGEEGDLPPVRWDNPSTLVRLPYVTSEPQRRVFAINSSGAAVGMSAGGHSAFPIRPLPILLTGMALAASCCPS